MEGQEPRGPSTQPSVNKAADRMRTYTRVPIFGSGALLLVLASILDACVIGLLPPDLELVRRGRRTEGALYSGGGKMQMLLLQTWTGSLCLRGGAQDTVHPNGKRARRAAEGVLDAEHVESLHAAMARADAAKYMNPKVRPAAKTHPTLPVSSLLGDDVVKRKVQSTAATGQGATGEVAGGSRLVEGGSNDKFGAKESGGREGLMGDVDGGQRQRENEGRGREATGHTHGGEHGGHDQTIERAGVERVHESPWLQKVCRLAEEMLLLHDPFQSKRNKENVTNSSGAVSGESATSTSAYAAEQTKQTQRCEEEAGGLVDHFKSRMLSLLNWRNGSNDSESNGEKGKSREMTEAASVSSRVLGVPPEHSRGGFACVILDREYGVAYRLEPMQNAVDAAAWLAFHVVLEAFGVKAAAAVEVDRPAQVFRPDRGLSTSKPITVWNQTSVVRTYQDPTLDAFSRHVVKQRNRILRKVRDEPGLVGDIVLASSEAAKAESMIMTPRLWFWHKFHMRAMPEDENKSLCQNDFVRRVRGRELADALCHSNTSTCVCGTGQGSGMCSAPMHGPHAVPSSKVRTVRLLCSVFDLASGDLFTSARRRWRQGAPPTIVPRLIHDIGQALRCMHACGVAHGDLKMANVLKTGEAYKLADLPALTRATTKMLTSDPVVSTRITSGRRMLSNDMWGLGLVSITLLAGTTAFRKVCEKFKAIAPEAGDAAAMWLIFAAGFLTALATYSRRMLPPNAERDEHLGAIGAAQKTFIQSVTGRQMIKRLHRKHREEARDYGESVAKLVVAHADFAHVWQQVSYCMDVSNIARNALAMPLPPLQSYTSSSPATQSVGGGVAMAGGVAMPTD